MAASHPCLWQENLKALRPPRDDSASWTLKTHLGAWVPSWLHWKSRHISETAGISPTWDKHLLQLGRSMNNRIQKGLKPNCKAVSRTSLQTAHLPGAQDHPTWPPDPPPPHPTEGSLPLILAPFLLQRGLSKASPKFLSGLWSISTAFEEPKNPSWWHCWTFHSPCTSDHLWPSDWGAGDAVSHQWPNQWSLPNGRPQKNT